MDLSFKYLGHRLDFGVLFSGPFRYIKCILKKYGKNKMEIRRIRTKLNTS
jgi:hypothetical protein